MELGGTKPLCRDYPGILPTEGGRRKMTRLALFDQLTACKSHHVL